MSVFSDQSITTPPLAPSADDEPRIYPFALCTVEGGNRYAGRVFGRNNVNIAANATLGYETRKRESLITRLCMTCEPRCCAAAAICTMRDACKE